VVLTLDTASVVAAHEADIELCKINSGFAQPHSKARRGASTFLSIEEYVHRSRVRARSVPPWDVSEFCVRDSLLDIGNHVLRVERRKQDEVLEVLFEA